MGFTPNGRLVVATIGLVCIGYALGVLTGVRLSTESALALLSGATLLVLVASRSSRD